MINYNKLFIIGNGFDLAHGLKTRYSDFFLWYFNKCISLINLENKSFYNDNLINISLKSHEIKEFTSLESINKYLKSDNITLKFKNNFFETIFRKFTDLKWVNIEYEYYLKLIEVYDLNEKYKGTNIYNLEQRLKELNNCFNYIKEQIIEYLNTIEVNSSIYNEQIELHLKNEIFDPKIERNLFLVFNYTETIELYLNELNVQNYQIIYIHGKLNDKENPIIFGYGDEMDEYYNKIERLNINDFLTNIKSFNYFKTSNYRNLFLFLNLGYFNVNIMGHSCGISDRILLNGIFTNQMCNLIKIFYHKINDNDNDFFEKTQEISRHFKAEEKNRMRNIIIPFTKSFPLTQ